MKPKEFAKKEGFDNAEVVGSWKKFTVYEAYFEPDEFGNVPKIGFPQYILEIEGALRFSTPDETFEIMATIYEDEEDEED